MSHQPGFSDGYPVDSNERVAPHVTATLAAAAVRSGEAVQQGDTVVWVSEPVPVGAATRDLSFQVAHTATLDGTLTSTHPEGGSPFTQFGTN